MFNTTLLYKKAALTQLRKTQGTVTWRCPSNISLIKYWGKYGELLPFNPSISLTLKNAHTETKIEYMISDKPSIDYFSEGVRKTNMIYAIKEYFERLKEYFSFLPVLKLVIHSSNSFPEYSGIIPTSSEIGAIALCLCSIEEELTGTKASEEEFFRKASIIARLGSGCATRSIYGGSVLWGKHTELNSSSDSHAAPLDHDSFLDDLNVAFLIVSKSHKTYSPPIRNVSMEFYNLASMRCEHAKVRSSMLLEIIRIKDYFAFCKLVEGEALTLHKMLLSSSPQSLLNYPITQYIIAQIRAFREKYSIPVCFTIDVAPNIHLLYPKQYRDIVLNFIKEKLVQNCEEKKWLDDMIGSGPEKINKIL
jgi:diphosphomevalonate decarboxylase